MKIPGLSFSWKRALGITQVKRDIAKKTGIPMTTAGFDRSPYFLSLYNAKLEKGYTAYLRTPSNN